MPAEPCRSFPVERLSVCIHADAGALAAAAAREAHAIIAEALRARGKARVLFACAASQVKFLAALRRLPALDWSGVTALHMDEYLGLPATHPASFRRFLREHVAGPLGPGAVEELAGDAPEAAAECRRYAALLAPPVDLCCLGIGENGHLAFNDPPFADFHDPWLVKRVTLDAACRRQQVGEGAFPTLEAVPREALTLTLPALCAARRMVCIVPDLRKAAAVHAALRGPLTPACPASWLRTAGHCTLHLDPDSASRLG